MQNQFRSLLFAFLVTTSVVGAQDSRGGSNANPSRSNPANQSSVPTSTPSPTAPAASLNTDPSYSLIAGDTILITIGTRSNPSEISTSPTISKNGDVRLPWIDDEIVLEKKTVRDAERFLEKLYKERKLLKAPVVSVRVSNYFLREIFIFGAVNRPGAFPFPHDTVSMDIGQLIGKIGGFTPVANARKVTVARREPSGKEVTFDLDLESLVTGKRKAGRNWAEFLIYPGDTIHVPETVF